MSLAPGSRLGAYEIVSALGAGGMGEVYRARDTRLNREVALKTLPPAFTSDAERLARFRREAQVLAALNHPHIGAIYGLDEIGGAQFLVLELVDGQSLDQRIARGPIARGEALVIARQIADALEAAHDKGIIHRDLKPANLAQTSLGDVKVLDFGLAKAAEPASALGADPANSPTLTSPVMTFAGMILGTAAYMSPEQARGKAVDKRADIWAFGCVLFEMLTGRQAFGGETVSDSIAAVIHKDPPWEALPLDTPPALRALLRRCLQKDPRQRLRDAGDLRLALDDLENEPQGPVDSKRPRRAGIVSAVGAAILAALAGATLTRMAGSPTATHPSPIARFSISLPADAPLDVRGPWGSLAISRDGRTIAYVAEVSGERQLYLRRSDDFTPRVVAGGNGVWEAFFSPDGQWLAFVAADRLKKVAITGGQPTLLAEAANLNSGVWADDGSIYLGGRAGLVRVAPDGKSTMLLKPQPNETELATPDLLPDGSLLFTIKPNDVTSFDDARIGVLTPAGDRRVVLEGGSYGRYVPTGHLVYARAGAIMAVPFDAQRLAITGQPATVAQGGMFDAASGSAQFAISRTGVLAYAPGGPVPHELTLAWIDRRGTVTPIPAPPRFYSEPAVSPDGRQIAFDIRAANDDIWIYDVARSTFARLTFTHGNNQAPIWSPDGTRLVYAVDRLGVRRLVWRPADGTGTEETLTPARYYQTAGSWSPDGKVLAYTEDRPETGSDIYLLPIEGDKTPRPFLTTPMSERDPVFSPDGRWIAYESDETGRFEVFVTPFPGPGRKWQISSGGGRLPMWSRGGRELVYANGDRLMAVALTTAPGFEASAPRELLKLPASATHFNTAPDGDRFLILQQATPDVVVRELHVVLNWFDELASRVK